MNHESWTELIHPWPHALVKTRDSWWRIVNGIMIIKNFDHFSQNEVHPHLWTQLQQNCVESFIWHPVTMVQNSIVTPNQHIDTQPNIKYWQSQIISCQILVCCWYQHFVEEVLWKQHQKQCKFIHTHNFVPKFISPCSRRVGHVAKPPWANGWIYPLPSCFLSFWWWASIFISLLLSSTSTPSKSRSSTLNFGMHPLIYYTFLSHSHSQLYILTHFLFSIIFSLVVVLLDGVWNHKGITKSNMNISHVMK